MLKKHDTAVLVTPIARSLPNLEADWIGVDAGYEIIRKHGKEVLFALGDFDSLDGKPDENLEVYISPVAKDEPDSELALRRVYEMGYDKVILWGGLSGRLDHTIANLRLMEYDYPKLVLMDENQMACVLEKGEHTFGQDYRHISFFALEPSVISLSGFEYNLPETLLKPRQIYTLSNKVTGPQAKAVIRSGRVLCVQSNCK